MNLRLFAILIGFMPAAAGAAVQPMPADLPRRALAMFWAPWCAPCRAELRDYANLAASAAPAPLFVIVLDATRSTMPNSVPAERVLVSQERSTEALARWLPNEPGLPLTIAIDAKGRICATRRGGLRVVDIDGLRGCAVR